MCKKIIVCLASFFLVLFIVCFYFVFDYLFTQRNNKTQIAYCLYHDTDRCHSQMFELLLPKILVNDAYIDGKRIEFIKMDYTSRIDSMYALSNSDVLLGYGVGDEISYEERYAELFDKHSYAFDCGVPFFKPNQEKCSFSSECIASDKFLIFDHLFTNKMQVSSGKVHSLEQKLKELNLSNKSVFIKMDIAEADIVGIPEIINNSDNILGFNIAVFLGTPADIIKRLALFDKLNEKFVLVSRTMLPYNDRLFPYEIDSKYYNGGFCNGYVYFSYVNKKILDSYNIALFQDTDNFIKKNVIYSLYSKSNGLSYDNISIIVTLIERIRQFGRNFL